MVRLLNLIPCVAGKTFHFQAWWHWRVVAGVTGAPVMLVRLSGDTLQEELCWPDYSQKKPKSLSKFVNEDLPAHRQAVVERQVAAATQAAVAPEDGTPAPSLPSPPPKQHTVGGGTNTSGPAFFGWGPMAAIGANNSRMQPRDAGFSIEQLKTQFALDFDAGNTGEWAALPLRTSAFRVVRVDNTVVDREVLISSDLTWAVHVRGKLLNTTPFLELAELRERVVNYGSFRALLDRLDDFRTCGGVYNAKRYPEKLYKVKVDNGQVISGTTPRFSLVTHDCMLLCGASCCTCCEKLGDTLRGQLSKDECGGAERAADSTSNTHLDRLSATDWRRRYEHAKALSKGDKQRVARLRQRERVLQKKLLEYRGQDDDGYKRLPSDQHAAFVQLLRDMERDKAAATDQSPTLALLLASQLDRWEKPHCKRQWHPLILKWCISIFSKSHAAYDELRESGFLTLPHVRTLQRYMQGVRQHGGKQRNDYVCCL